MTAVSPTDPTAEAAAPRRPPRGAGTFRLAQLEMIKLARARLFWAGFLLLVGFAVAVVIGFKYSTFGRLQGILARIARGADYRQYVNGMLYTGWSLFLGYYLLVPLIASVAFGQQLAGEIKDGTLRTLLVRPVSRGQIFAAKFLATSLYLLVVVVVYYAVCLALGHLFLGNEQYGLVAFGKTFFNDEGHRPWIIGRDLAIQRMALGTVLGCLALAPIASLAYLVSACVENPLIAVLTSFTAHITCTVLGEVQFFTALKPYLFTTYMSFWKGVFSPTIDWEAMVRPACYCGLYAAGFLIVAFAVFVWRDIKT